MKMRPLFAYNNTFNYIFIISTLAGNSVRTYLVWIAKQKTSIITIHTIGIASVDILCVYANSNLRVDVGYNLYSAPYLVNISLPLRFCYASTTFASVIVTII